MESDLHGSVSECVHHWLIDTPTATSSHGVCKLCGATREFPNESAPRFSVARRKVPPLLTRADGQAGGS